MRYLIFITLFLIGCKPEVSEWADVYGYEASLVEQSNAGITGKLEYIVIHTTASRGSHDAKFFEDIWKKNGWDKVGYSYLVLKDGSIWVWVEHKFDDIIEPFELTYGVRGRNLNSVHIAYEGGVDNNLKPKDTRTDKQKASLKWLINRHLDFAPEAEIVGHRDIQIYTNKACPSFDVKSEFCKNKENE